MLDSPCYIYYSNNSIINNMSNSDLIQKFNLLENWYKPTVYAATYIHNTVNKFGNLLLNKIDFKDEISRKYRKIEKIKICLKK